MTREQAHRRNNLIFRIRGQLKLFKNIPTDIIRFGSYGIEGLRELINKLRLSLNKTAINNKKYTYYCSEHISPACSTGKSKVTKNSKAICEECGKSTQDRVLFYIKKDRNARTNQN